MTISNPLREKFHFYIVHSGQNSRQMCSCYVYVYFHSLSHITLQAQEEKEKEKEKGDTVLR
jgi:hypothetical protein